MTDNQQRAKEIAGPGLVLVAEVAAALDAAEKRGRAEGYRAAVKDSRVMCARSGGCL